MKILVFFTLYLISGPVLSSDVIGYTGGSVLINSNRQWRSGERKVLCKKRKECVNIINSGSNNTTINEGRFSLYENSQKKVTLLIQQLKPEDASEYQFGGRNEKTEIELKVKGPCCGGTLKLTAYLGHNFTINCPYPEEFEERDKLFYKLHHPSITEEILNTGGAKKRDRLSISEDRRSKVFSVRISDVREDDGVYFCGVKLEEGSITYISFYTEIQLQVTAPGSSIIIIITVCVCVPLLLIGGLTLMFCYVTHKKRRESSPQSKAGLKDNKQVCNFEGIPRDGVNADDSSSTGDFLNVNFSTQQPTSELDPAYSTVSFQKNPALSTDAAVHFHQGEHTEYATVRFL